MTESITIGGIQYRIEYTALLGWTVTIGHLIKYWSADHSDCVQWIHRHAGQKVKS